MYHSFTQTDKRPTPNPVLAVWSLKEYDLVEAREAAWKHVESPLLDKGYRLYWDEDDQYEPNLPAPQNYFAPGPHEALNAAVMNREEGPMWSWSTMVSLTPLSAFTTSDIELLGQSGPMSHLRGTVMVDLWSSKHSALTVRNWKS